MLGLAFLAAYIPLLLLVAWVGRMLARSLAQNPDGAGAKGWAITTATASGAVLAAVIALGLASLVPSGGMNWAAWAAQVGVTLVVPLVLGIVFVLAAKAGRASVATVIVNGLGIGAFNGVWFTPIFVGLLSWLPPQYPHVDYAEVCYQLVGVPADAGFTFKFRDSKREMTAERFCVHLALTPTSPSIVISQGDIEHQVSIVLKDGGRTCIGVFPVAGTASKPWEARVVECS